MTTQHTKMFTQSLREFIHFPATQRSARNVSSSASLNGNRISVRWPDNSEASFPQQWLRDHCRCPECYNFDTNQRQVDTYHCVKEIAYSVSVRSSKLEVEFPTHKVSFSLPWLKSHQLPHKSPAPCFPYQDVGFPPKKKLWTNDSLELPRVAYKDYINELEAEKEALRGFDHYGILLVTGTPSKDMSATEAFGVKLGHFILPTMYGTMWSTQASQQKKSTQDTAYGSDTLEVHTDCTYLRETPGVQIFNCAIAAELGGENRFVDGFQLVKSLSMEAIAFFATQAVPFGCNDDGFDLRTDACMIQGHGQGDVFIVNHFRHNDYDRRVLQNWDAEAVEAFYEYHAELTSLIRKPQAEMSLLLDQGDMIVVDNQRVMHGRYGFQGTRALVGCYLNKDCVESRIRTLVY